jgi:hypothetical protein
MCPYSEQEEDRGDEISIQHIGEMKTLKTLDGQKRMSCDANRWPT